MVIRPCRYRRPKEHANFFWSCHHTTTHHVARASGQLSTVCCRPCHLPSDEADTRCSRYDTSQSPTRKCQADLLIVTRPHARSLAHDQILTHHQVDAFPATQGHLCVYKALHTHQLPRHREVMRLWWRCEGSLREDGQPAVLTNERERGPGVCCVRIPQLLHACITTSLESI